MAQLLQKNELVAIAEQTRHMLMTPGQVSAELLLWLYGLYLPYGIDGLELHLAEFMPQFPNGGCQYSTVFLRHMVGVGFPENGTYKDEPHTFLNVGVTAVAKETIMDVTANQKGFNGPEVYVGPLVEPWGGGVLVFPPYEESYSLTMTD